MQIKITDFSDENLNVYARLNENELSHFYEPVKEGLFIAETPNVIVRALDAGYEPVSMLVEDNLYVTNLPLISRCGDVPVYTAPLPIIEKLTGYTLTRGVLCAMRRKTLPSAYDICSNARRIVILEDVMNPTNVGAMFRSAAALGMDAMLLTKGSSDPLYRRASRVSMGTVFQISWTFIDDIETVCRSLSFKTVAMALRPDSMSIDDEMLKKEPRLAVVLGTEGDGLRNETITKCDYTVMIPMMHGVDSLNVAAAGAVACWELGKRSR
ncbi:MAG: RNA methyltransferase [Lachnospiraceae bacterium]|nr:RNA methyltransferase [Lachnospiraceae bacterium]